MKDGLSSTVVTGGRIRSAFLILKKQKVSILGETIIEAE